MMEDIHLITFAVPSSRVKEWMESYGTIRGRGIPIAEHGVVVDGQSVLDRDAMNQAVKSIGLSFWRFFMKKETEPALLDDSKSVA